MSRHPPTQYDETRILDTLRACEGNQRKASEILGKSQSWLAKWLRKNKYKMVVQWVKEPEMERAS
jgi:hypothetical protein